MVALPGDRLTEAHRAAQVRNAAGLAGDLARRFRGVELGNVQSERNFLDLATPLVLERNARSTSLALDYLRNLQGLEARGAVTHVDPAPTPSVEQVRTSLAVTGPIAWSQRMKRAKPADTTAGERDRAAARQVAGAGLVGSAIRHAQNGARDTVRLYVARDERAKAYVRITAMDMAVCYFCAALAGRVDWKDDSFDESDAGFEGLGTAKVHDNCRCHLRPIYSGALPDSVEAYRRAWKAMSGGEDGAMLNFRRNWSKRSEDWDSQREVA